MLKKISVTVLATALLASPVFAAKPKTPKPAHVECGTVEQLEKAAAEDGAKIEFKFTGDALEKLNSYAKSKNGTVPPEGTDTVVILSKPRGPESWLGVIFVHGCAKIAFPVDPKAFKKVLEGSQGETL